MSINHEYSVIGHSRSTIGRWLGVIAGLLSSAIASILAGAFALADSLGLTPIGPDPIVIPATAAIFYFLGHLAFDRWAWRKTLVHKVIGIPDLNGVWKCAAQTLDQSGAITYEWSADINIYQTWEKIKVHLNTDQSRSNSVAASLIKEDGIGFILMYSYRNEPRPGEAALHSHIGYCELHISADLKTAEGMYFNSGGRFTYGKMFLTRE